MLQSDAVQQAMQYSRGYSVLHGSITLLIDPIAAVLIGLLHVYRMRRHLVLGMVQACTKQMYVLL